MTLVNYLNGQPNFWPAENSTLNLLYGSSTGGPWEVTLLDSGTLNSIGVTYANLGVYFILQGNIADSIKLTPGSNVTLSQTFAHGSEIISANILQCTVIFGLWIGDNTIATFENAYVYLFMSPSKSEYLMVIKDNARYLF